MQNSATINSVVTQGGTINSTVVTGSTIQSTLTGGGIGPAGATGPAGTNGTVWHEAGGAPSTIYANGDYYLNTLNGDVYVQTGNAWGSPVGNIKGPPGPEGAFPYTNVSDYGAVGDGTTDDTTAIANAIAAATLHGGTVFFPTPAVNYLISSELTLTTGVSILGTGSEACEIYQSSSTTNGIFANDAASISIQGIYLNGPGAGSGVGIAMGWTAAGNVPFLDFRDIKVYNFGSDGMAIETPIVSNFTQVVCKSNGGYGTNFYHAGTSCVFNDCWMRENALAGYHFYESVYMSLNGCAADGNGVGYLVENAQSINFNGCGAESQVVGSGQWDGTGFKISNSSVIGLHNVWLTNNPAIGIWITNGSIACEVFGAADNSPGGSATAFVKTDVSTNSTLSDIHNTTANSYSPGTVTILNDGANNLTTKQATIKDASGSLILTATSDGAGGQFSLQADTTGILDIFGQGGQTLNVNLLDGYLQLTPLTATTVPYLDSNKRFASSSVTPTELGYVHGVTSAIQTQLNALLTNPMTTLGDTLYENGTPAAARLPGNTSATMAVHTQTGNGTISAAPVWTTTTGTGSIVAASSPTITSLTVNTSLTANTLLNVVGTSGTLAFTAATNGGDYNIFSANGAQTLALFGSSTATLNLNLLDGALSMGSNLTISNAGVHTNSTFDTAGTGNVFKINGTAISAVTGTGAVVLASSPALTTPNLGTPSAINLSNATATSLPVGSINATGVAGSTTYLRGDGSWQTISAGFANPMTTLGDIMYENATPAAARLAGSTSATIAVLTQTGNGTISAAPAWVTATGTGSPVFGTSPTLVTPALGTPSALVGTNISGTAASLTAGHVTNATLTTALTVNTGTLTLTANAANTSVLTIGAGAVSVSGSNTGDQTNISGNAATVTTNANLTGVITSVGNATSIASQTGTGTRFVTDTSPTLVTPALGVATATSVNKVTITAPASSATLTLITGSSLITAGAFALTLTSGQSTNVTIPTVASLTMARIDAAQTFTGIQTLSSAPVLSSGTLTSVAATMTFPATATTLAGLAQAATWTSAQTFSTAPVFNALPTGTAVASASTASTLMSRDSNGNTVVVNLQQGYTSTATAAGTTTLTAASSNTQVFTGTSTQIIVLPAVSTLTQGTDYIIVNQSTAALTIESSGANSIVVLGAGQIATLTSNATSGTGAAVWNYAMEHAVYDFRNNNGTPVVEANSHVETGWVDNVIGAASHAVIAVTWAHPFTALPIVMATYGGDATSATTYGSGSNTVKGPVACKATDITVNGCNIYIHSSDGTSWAAGNVVFAQYMAVGI
jgi:hypothetical protein